MLHESWWVIYVLKLFGDFKSYQQYADAVTNKPDIYEWQQLRTITKTTNEKNNWVRYATAHVLKLFHI